MRPLRPNFLHLLIALLVFVGYSEVLRGGCGDEPQQVTAGECPDSHSHSGDADGCHCICHQSFLNDPVAAGFEPGAMEVLALVSERALRPPESLPLGIDYPPQLA